MTTGLWMIPSLLRLWGTNGPSTSDYPMGYDLGNVPLDARLGMPIAGGGEHLVVSV